MDAFSLINDKCPMCGGVVTQRGDYVSSFYCRNNNMFSSNFHTFHYKAMAVNGMLCEYLAIDNASMTCYDSEYGEEPIYQLADMGPWIRTPEMELVYRDKVDQKILSLPPRRLTMIEKIDVLRRFEKNLVFG